MNRIKLNNFLDKLLKEYMGNRPGVSIGIILNNGKIFTKNYGLANISTKEKINKDTNFRLASVTKQFTATCILQLIEKKEIKIKRQSFRIFPSI